MPPLDLEPLKVQIKNAWSDNWTDVPNVEPINARISTGGQIGSFQFRVRYGRIKYPADTEFDDVDHTQINRQWVRCLRHPYNENTDLLFLGRIENDTRQVYGADSGVQVFSAYDGAQILNKIELFQSAVEQGANATVMIDELLPFNLHPNSKQGTSNRSENEIDGSYVFAHDADDEWEVQEAINYLFNYFASDPNGPTWTVSGETLNFKLQPTRLKAGSLLAALRQILAPLTGYSFRILPKPDGYEFKIFSTNTLTTPVTFGSVTIPANPDTVTVTNATNPEIEVRIEESQVNQVKKVIVLGNPMVICRSFSWSDGTILKDWEDPDPTSLINEYNSARDDERSEEKYQNLWTRWVADFDPNDWTGANNPVMQADGTIDTNTAAPVPVFAGTLNTLPMKTGNDYRDGMPATELDGDFMRPMMFLHDFRDQYLELRSFDVDAELKPLDETIGVHVQTEYPHVFSGDFAVDSLHPTVFYTGQTVITVAFESTQRLRLEHEEANYEISDGVHIIEIPDAEYWWVAANTMLSIDPDRVTPVKTISHFTVRNDLDKLELAMAGAISRYISPRGKASGSARGLFTWHNDLGKVLLTDDPDVRSILTSVSWTFENGFRTQFSSGFAR